MFIRPKTITIEIYPNAGLSTIDRRPVDYPFTLRGIGINRVTSIDTAALGNRFDLRLTDQVNGKDIVPTLDLYNLFRASDFRFLSFPMLGFAGYEFSQQGFVIEVDHDVAAGAYLTLVLFGTERIDC